MENIFDKTLRGCWRPQGSLASRWRSACAVGHGWLSTRPNSERNGEEVFFQLKSIKNVSNID